MRYCDTVHEHCPAAEDLPQFRSLSPEQMSGISRCTSWRVSVMRQKNKSYLVTQKKGKAHMKNNTARVSEVLIQIPHWNSKTGGVITATAIKVL